MKRFNLLSLFVFLFLCSCDSTNIEPAERTIIHEAKRIIDDGVFPHKYIKINKFQSSEHGSIYWLINGNSPFGVNSNPPKEILKYKGKYICLIDPFSNDYMSKTELQAELNTEIEHWEFPPDKELEKFYHVGVSKDGKKLTIVPGNDADDFTTLFSYMYPELSEYFWGKKEDETPRFVAMGYNLWVDNSFKPDSLLNEHLLYLFGGEMYFSNSQDPYFADRDDNSMNVFFATVNGEDTLKYIIDRDTIRKHAIIETEENPSFFKRLRPEDTWQHLCELFKDSTFYIKREYGHYEQTQVAFLDALITTHDVKNDSGNVMEIYQDRLNDWPIACMDWNEE